MKKRIYEQSIQNARIDLNLITNRAKFDYPTKRMTKLEEWIEITVLLFIPYLLFYGSIYLIYFLLTTDFSFLEEKTVNVFVYKEMLQGIFIIIIFFLPPMLTSFLMVYLKRTLLRYIPKIQYIYARTQRTFFVARFDKFKSKKIEIPLFRNIILNYKATGEVAKYIERIKIVEHPFMHVVTKMNGSVVRPNSYLWKAIFTFSKIPKNGRLDVYFI